MGWALLLLLLLDVLNEAPKAPSEAGVLQSQQQVCFKYYHWHCNLCIRPVGWWTRSGLGMNLGVGLPKVQQHAVRDFIKSAAAQETAPHLRTVRVVYPLKASAQIFST